MSLETLQRLSNAEGRGGIEKEKKEETKQKDERRGKWAAYFRSKRIEFSTGMIIAFSIPSR